MHLKRALSIALAMMMIFVISLGTGYTQEDNLLANPDFEDGFREVTDFPAEIANGWEPWNAEGSAFPPFYISVAEADATGLIARVNSGEEAQVYYSSFSTHDAGIYQQVDNITLGTELEFSIFAYIFSNDDAANLDSSDQPGDVEVRVGIDPTGGTDPASSNVVYSDASTIYDNYEQFSVSATATSDTVTVFVHTKVNETVINSIVYLDTASLAVVEPVATEEPTEEVTEAPVATEEPTEEVTEAPVVTEEPTEEVTEVPVVTEEVTQEPVMTEEPTAEVTEAPVATEEPVVTEEPTEEDMATEEATEEAMPTEEADDESILENYPEQITHTVQRGDNVNDIAIQYDSSIAAILAANDLDENALIFIGQVLVVPVKALPDSDMGDGIQDMGDGEDVETDVYIVTSGDTLYSIANRFNTTIGALAQLNGLSNANRLSIGQELRIPVGDDVKPYDEPVDDKPLMDEEMSEPPRPDDKPYHSGYAHHEGALLYVVQPGDTLYRISIKFDVSLVALAEINNISNYQLVFVGQTLIIPSK